MSRLTPIPAFDTIPSWTAWYRKMVTIRTVSRYEVTGVIGQRQYAERMSAVQRRAVETRDMSEKTAAFWKMENLSASFLKGRTDGESLNDPHLPLEVRPIAHCGMGIGAVELAEFDPARISALIDSFSNPDYRLFAYEGSGAMLALYEPDLFSAAARGFSVMGLIPMARLKRPPTKSFRNYFAPEIQWLIAHGYGRMLYFKSTSATAAVKACLRIQDLDVAASVQGVAFAYAMVNNSDLVRVLSAGDRISDQGVRESFDRGLIYALEFWEWMAPGFLNSIAPSPLVIEAKAQIQRARAAGILRAFRVV